MTGGHLTHVINMANSIVGVSILSMPYCFKETGILLGICLVLFSGFITKKTCMFLVRSAIMSRRRSFEFLAFHVFGVTGKLFVELCMILFLIGICISFHVVMGDLAPAIIARSMNIDNSPSLRVTLLIGIAVLVILPLCLLRNIESLSSMSACSIGFYCFLITVILYHASPKLIDGSWYTNAEMWKLDGALQVMPICSLALACQSNVFEIYDSVPDPDVPKMRTVVNQAVNLCMALYIGVGFLGYVAFVDKDFGGNIIMSFPSTSLTEGIKMFFVVSLAISFPLMIFPCRTSIHSLLFRRNNQGFDLVGNYMPETRFKGITFGILFISLIFGIMIPNIEFVLGLLGSTMGMVIAFILPSVLFIKVQTKRTNDRLFAQFIMILGLIMLVTGTYLNLSHVNRAEAPQPEAAVISSAEKDLFKIPEQRPPMHNIPPPAEDKQQDYSSNHKPHRLKKARKIINGKLKSHFMPHAYFNQDESAIKIPETIDKEIRKEPVAPEPPPDEKEKDPNNAQEQLEVKDTKKENSVNIQEKQDYGKQETNLEESKSNKIKDKEEKVVQKFEEEKKENINLKKNSKKKTKKEPEILHPDAIVKEEQEAEEEGDDKVKEKTQDGNDAIENKQEELLQQIQKQQNEQQEILEEQKKLLQELKEQKEEIHDAGAALAAAGVLQQQVNAAAQIQQAAALQQGGQPAGVVAQIPQAGGAVQQLQQPAVGQQPGVVQQPAVRSVVEQPAAGNLAPQPGAGNLVANNVNPPQAEILEPVPAKPPAPLELEVKPVGNAPPEVQKQVQEAIKKIHEGQAALQKAQDDGHIALEPAALPAPAQAVEVVAPAQQAAPAVAVGAVAPAAVAVEGVAHADKQQAVPVIEVAQANIVQGQILQQALPNPDIQLAHMAAGANVPVVHGRQLKGQSVVSSAAPAIQVKVERIKKGTGAGNDQREAYIIKENQAPVPPQQVQKVQQKVKHVNAVSMAPPQPSQKVQQKPKHIKAVSMAPSGSKGELGKSKITSNNVVVENGPILHVLTDAADHKSHKGKENKKPEIKDTQKEKHISNKDSENIHAKKEMRRKRALDVGDILIEESLPLVDLEKDLNRNIGEIAYDTRHLLWTEGKRKK